MNSSSRETLAELQFLVGLPPGRLWRLLASHGGNARRVRRVLQIACVGLLAGLARRSPPFVPARTLAAPPVFIIGHWRSGTSALQRLMACDPAFRTPSFLECAFPHAPGGLRPWFLRRLAAKLPATRGFDTFPLDVDAEFEDEFALLKLTLESPMLAFVFPSRAAAVWRHFLDEPASERWQAAMLAFVCGLNAGNRRVLLKSPTHAFRVSTLNTLFPGARFIDIRRDPSDVFQSTCELERRLLRDNNLEAGEASIDESFILRRQALHAAAVRDAARQAGPRRFITLDFEALRRDPRAVIDELSEVLGLGPFRPDMERFARTARGLRQRATRWPRFTTIRGNPQAMSGETACPGEKRSNATAS